MTLKEMKKKSRKQKLNNWIGTIELMFSGLLLLLLIFLWNQVDIPLGILLILEGIIGIVTGSQLMGNNPLTDKLKEEAESKQREVLENNINIKEEE